jgi:hypothetical protein
MSSTLQKRRKINIMSDVNDASFKRFFFNAYLSFQAKTQKRTVTAFAKYLSEKNKHEVTFSQQLVSGWLNGDFEPGEKYIHALSDVICDDVYDLLEIQRPDPDLQLIKNLWKNLTEEARRKLADQAGRYAVGIEDAKKPKPK